MIDAVFAYNLLSYQQSIKLPNLGISNRSSRTKSII